MKRLLIALLLLISTATAAFAADSAPSVLRVNIPQRDRLEVDLGMTQIHTKAADIRIAWLPLLAPLPYSYPRTTTEVPNALVLLGTSIPQRRRAVVTIGQQ